MYGFSIIMHQAIIYTSDEVLSAGPVGRNLSEIRI